MQDPVWKSVFKVPAMDCAAEENLIRLRLAEIDAVDRVLIELADRSITVYHHGSPTGIETALDALDLGATHVSTTEAGMAPPEDVADQHRILWAVLLINLSFFVVEMATGVIAASMSLIADSLDMLADSLVYAMSLLAVGASAARKRSAARWSGYLQAALAVGGFVEVLRRFFGLTELPDFRLMIAVSALALAANAICLFLLQKTRQREAHIRASMIFTSNDIVINFGVIVAGVMVNWLGSGVPDLVVGGIVFAIVTRGAMRILALARAPAQ